MQMLHKNTMSKLGSFLLAQSLNIKKVFNFC